MKNLISVKVPKSETATVESVTNHILVIDCSGSMYYDLPKIRQQLKNKLPSMVKESDTVSLIWFSGRGEFGNLVSRVKVQDLNDLQRLNIAIDRWLKPMGCTGFVEPIKSVYDLIDDDCHEGSYSMMFLTDGCDNQWNRNEIIDSVKELEPLLAGAVFVEYGWYCNHALLEEMASEIGGSVVFAEDFDSYDPIFDGVITKGFKSAKKVEIPVKNPEFDFVFSISDTGVCSYKVENDKVRVPTDIDEIYYYSDSPGENVSRKAQLLGLSSLILRRKGSFVKEQLRKMNEGYLYNRFANCFGKQNLYDFQQTLEAVANGAPVREEKIEDNKTAFTVLNLLRLLQDGDCKIDLGKMKYSRIGRATVKSKELTDKEKTEIIQAIENSETADDLKEAMDKQNKILASKQETKFVPDTMQVGISNITWNDTRPNVSMLFTIHGKVELPEDRPYCLSKQFSTNIYRNYAVLRDGLVNIDILPVVLKRGVFDTLSALGIVSGEFSANEVYEINLRKLPLINENMISEVSAESYFRKLYSIFEAKAVKKVCNAFIEEITPSEKCALIKEKFGEEAAEYLKNLGITDQGYSPKVETVPGTDSYIATELVAKFKGMSSIPSFNAVSKKIAEGKKINAADRLLVQAMELCESKKKEFNDEKKYLEWLWEAFFESDEEIKKATRELAETRFAIIVGQTWFKEFETIEDCKMTLQFGEDEIECNVELKDTVEII